MSEIVNLSQLDLQHGIYTYADYLSWKFEQAVEVIKGKILPMSAPSRKHQGISSELHGLIYNHFKGHPCKFYAAPFDVRLYDSVKSRQANKDILTVVQPDISIICDLSKLDDKGCLGPPDLVIEILSPGNSAKEMKIKKALYQENGIREYLIFDPEHDLAFQFHLIGDGIYSPPALFVSDDVFSSVIFPGLHFPLKEVFDV